MYKPVDKISVKTFGMKNNIYCWGSFRDSGFNQSVRYETKEVLPIFIPVVRRTYVIFTKKLSVFFLFLFFFEVASAYVINDRLTRNKLLAMLNFYFVFASAWYVRHGYKLFLLCKYCWTFTSVLSSLCNR